MLRVISLLTLVPFLSVELNAADAHWIRLQSSNFELYSSASPRSARDTLREFEEVRGFFLQAFGGPPAKPVPVRLVAFGSAKEFEPYKFNEFATAYYHPTADRDYIVMSHSGADIFPTAVHEYVHLLVRHADMNLPPWLSEGLAELYSTLKPLGDKILVGDLIRGRHQALLTEKWVPLTVILAADRNSPYYNEKNKAGSLYNESWALTHMLRFRDEYRAKFGDVVKAISGGEGSAVALTRIYGVPVDRIDKDLQAYLRGNFFQGQLVSAKLQHSTDDLPVEALAEFDANLMFADLIYLPGKESAAQAAFEHLSEQDPKRPEPYRALGYIAWRQNRRDDAFDLFGKAYNLGDHEPKLLWDYGRLAESKHRDDAIKIFTELVAVDSTRTDARIALADMHVRANHPKEAFQVLEPIKTIPPADAPRFFRVAFNAHIENGDPKSAEVVARHYQEIAKTDEDRAAAAELLSHVNMTRLPRPATGQPARPATSNSDERPILRRSDSDPAPAPTRRPDAPSRPTLSGNFVELDCRNQPPRMIVDTTAGRKTFLLADPDKVIITAGSEGPVDMTCGIQKKPAKVEVGYDPPPANLTGLQGVVKTLAF